MMIMMKKQQPWMFSMIINSSYSSSTMGRQFCSSTTTNTNTNTNTNTSCCLSSSSSSSVSHEPPTPQQKKQQQFNILLEKKLSLLSSSSSVSHGLSNKTLQQQKKQQQQLNILLEKKLPLLIVPYDYFTPHRYALSRETRDRYHFVCDGNLGFINVFHDDDDQLIINKKKKKKVEVCHMYFPELFRRKICGSSEGWLFTISGIGEFRLFNPVTRVVVHLPDFKAFPGLRPMLPLYKKNFRDSFIYKAVTNTTTNSTTAATTVVVMAICEYHRGLVFCRTSFSSSSSSSIGNGNGNGSSTTDHIVKPPAAWIKIPLKTPMSAGLLTKSLKTPMSAGLPTKSELHDLGRSSITRHILEEDITYEVIDGVTYWVSLKLSWWVDVLFYQGNFYAVSSEGVVGVVKGLDGPSPFVQFLLDASDETRDYSLIHHLVESSSSSSSSSCGGGGGGDLLMVLREMERQYPTIEFEVDQHIPYRTIGFRVLKLDLNGGGGGPSWEEVTDLGEDCALFVGYNHSFSFSASKIPGCRGNCIYFTDYHRLTIQYFPNGGHDIGVYNLEDGSVEKLNYATCYFQLYLPPPVWYAPN